jgi:hypothetical protein
VFALFRGSEWDTPWRVLDHRGEGRYHRHGSPPTQYWCLHPLTVYAERLRREGRGIIDAADTLRWRLWTALVDLDGLPWIEFSNAKQYGISPQALVNDDRSACIALADRCRDENIPGIVVPSAALPGTRNVVLFGERVMAPRHGKPVTPDLEVPTAHAAENGTPPGEILPYVCWIGDEHAELTAWRRGRRYVFTDPVDIERVE